MTIGLSFGQYNTDWYFFPVVSNSTQAGYIGIGTKTTTSTTNTPLPNYNLHVHGVADYISSGAVSGIIKNNDDPTSGLIESGGVNYGKTSRIGLTNTTTGRSDMEGTVLQMSELDFSLKNQSQGNMLLESQKEMKFLVPGFSLELSGLTDRAFIGGSTPTTDAKFARLTMMTGGDNGLYIQTQNTTKYGLSIKMSGDNANAIMVTGQGVTGTKNFKVTGSGEVFARKYTTTLNNIPDYVFAPEYDLMPLSELRTYIQANNHLPNIPSAEEMESQPVDLGEMNRLLLEKVEELTLYVLELEEKMDNLKENK